MEKFTAFRIGNPPARLKKTAYFFSSKQKKKKWVHAVIVGVTGSIAGWSLQTTGNKNF